MFCFFKDIFVFLDQFGCSLGMVTKSGEVMYPPPPILQNLNFCQFIHISITDRIYDAIREDESSDDSKDSEYINEKAVNEIITIPTNITSKDWSNENKSCSSSRSKQKEVGSWNDCQINNKNKSKRKEEKCKERRKKMMRKTSRCEDLDDSSDNDNNDYITKHAVNKRNDFRRSTTKMTKDSNSTDRECDNFDITNEKKDITNEKKKSCQSKQEQSESKGKITANKIRGMRSIITENNQQAKPRNTYLEFLLTISKF